MSRKMKVVLGLAAVLTVASLAAFAGWRPIDKQTALAAEPADQLMSALPRPPTLLEAWDTLDAYGKSWQTQAVIASIQSI